MTVQSLIPKGLKKFKAEKPYISEYETSITLRHDKPNIKQTPNGVVGRDFIVISKNKSSDVYHVKFYFEDRKHLGDSCNEMRHLLYSAEGIDYASEGAFTGGMLYQIWGRRDTSGKRWDSKTNADAKIESLLRAAIKHADKIV